MKSKFIPPVLFVALLSAAASCIKIDTNIDPDPVVEKDYTCDCTYVAVSGGPNDGQPNRNESNTIKAIDLGSANVKCKQLESKYMAEYFSGTCLIK